jgi:hypothetical protein
MFQKEGTILPRSSEATRMLTVRPKKNLALKKPAVGLFHISSEESVAPGTKINSLV